MRAIWLHLHPYLTNRYAWVLVFTLVWLAFFDRYDLFTRLAMQRKIAQLQADKAYYAKEIQRVRAERYRMRSNQSEVERIAREQYLMKRENEDLYIIVEKKPEE